MKERKENGSLHYRFEIDGDQLDRVEQLLAENKQNGSGLSIHTDRSGIIVRGDEVEAVQKTVIAGHGKIADSFALGDLLIRNGVGGFQRTVVNTDNR